MTADSLERLCRDLERPSRPDPDDNARIAVLHAGDELHVDYFGYTFDEAFERLSALLAARMLAERLASLQLRTPDEGANGTINWDLTALVDSSAFFPQLAQFTIQRTAPGDHNRTIVASEYEEAGVLGRLLRKSPRLRTLVVPSAPDASFFQVQAPWLECLRVDAGYDTQNFVHNLTETETLPSLKYLEFGEFAETYMDDFATHVTPLSHYERYFASPSFARLKSFSWRNPACPDSDVSRLRRLAPPEVSFQVVRFSSEYVR